MPDMPEADTMAQFLDHLSRDVLPGVVDRLFRGTSEDLPEPG
jgi:hypothetical protein